MRLAVVAPRIHYVWVFVHVLISTRYSRISYAFHTFFRTRNGLDPRARRCARRTTNREHIHMHEPLVRESMRLKFRCARASERMLGRREHFSRIDGVLWAVWGWGRVGVTDEEHAVCHTMLSVYPRVGECVLCVDCRQTCVQLYVPYTIMCRYFASIMDERNMGAGDSIECFVCVRGVIAACRVGGICVVL